MASSARVVVIGAGTAGCGAARRAAELEAGSVTLIDKGTPGSGSSGRSAGVYHLQAIHPLDIEVRLRSKELLLHLEKVRGLPLRRIGALRVARSPEDVTRCRDALAIQQSLGPTDSRLIDAVEIQRLIPHLNCAGVRAALYGPTDGSLDGHLVCSALVDEARDLGAQLRAGTELVGYEKRGTTHVLRTTTGTIECDVLINAAGAWATRVGAMIGHAARVDPEIHCVIRVSLPRPLGYAMPFVNFYVPGNAGQAVYFRQEGPELIAGLHSYDPTGHEAADPDHYSMPNGDDYLVEVAQQLSEHLNIEGLGFRDGWCGLYPLSRDGLFQVGPYAADPSVIAVAGLGGVGVTTGAALGALAAEWGLLGTTRTVPEERARQMRPDRASLAQAA